MSSPQTHLQSQSVDSLPNAGLPSYQPLYLIQENVSNPGPHFENELIDEMSACEDANAQYDLTQNLWHDASLFPDDEPPNSRATRVLKTPHSSSNNAEGEYTSLEVDELQALEDAIERVESSKVNFNNIGRPAYSKYGYPFRTIGEFYRALIENGFDQFGTPMDEPPMAVIDERELVDLLNLEKIDGLMDTKEMMKEMEKMEESD